MKKAKTPKRGFERAGGWRWAPLTAVEAAQRALSAPNIVSAYIAATLAADRETSSNYALSRLSAEYGTKIPPNRIAQWRVGSRPIPKDAHKIMLSAALPWILAQIGRDYAACPPRVTKALATLLSASPRAAPDVVEWLVANIAGVKFESVDNSKKRWMVCAVQQTHLLPAA